MNGSERYSWRFREGDEIVPGRHAVRLLGGGRRYEAYLSWDDLLHALVVVKILRPALVGDRDAQAGLELEARALERLAHPVVVRAFDAVLDGERPHLVLEHLDGPRLSTLVRRYGIAVEQLLTLALQLCSALHYLGAQGFVHLDVKPRNVIMGSPPRLIDLSIARPIEEARALTTPVGTDAYMAPEQCEPKRLRQIGPATDVWGLGATLYEALARRLPFGERDGDGRFPQVGAPLPPAPPGIPGEVTEPLLACLEQNPAARPTAAELARTLEPVVAALPAPRLGRFRPGSRRRPAV